MSQLENGLSVSKNQLSFYLFWIKIVQRCGKLPNYTIRAVIKPDWKPNMNIVWSGLVKSQEQTSKLEVKYDQGSDKVLSLIFPEFNQKLHVFP